MSLSSRVPRLTRAWLRRCLPADQRDGILGDLEEVFERDARQSGAATARRQYRRKARALASRFVIERVRENAGHLLAARVSALDVRLAARLLVKHPGLTIVGGIAMTFAIAVGAATYAFIDKFVHPDVPLPGGDRIVSIRARDVATGRLERRIAADFARWHGQLTSVTVLGAGRTATRNLTPPGGLAEPAAVAEVTAAAFEVAGVAPLFGRGIALADEAPGAPLVIVLGHELWRERFGANPSVVGTETLLGASPAIVVGVMPEGFRFPIAHDAWVPLRLPATPEAPRTGQNIAVWGRLADGRALEEARAEFEVLAAAAAADWPQTHQHLRLEVQPFALGAMDLTPAVTWLLLSVNLFIGLLLVLAAANVALLMFARAAARESEVLVRSALGASRGRLVAQFFVEALLLGGLSAALGLAVAAAGLRAGLQIFQLSAAEGERLPFWFTPDLSPGTVLYTVLLTMLAALIAGVLPALKITRGLQAGLRETTAGGGGLRFGGIWTAVIVAQVAVTVTFPAVTFFVQRDAWQIEAIDLGVSADSYLVARVSADDDVPLEQVRAKVSAVADRLRAQAGVQSVTFADRLPMMYHPVRVIELDAGPSAPREEDLGGYVTSNAGVDATFFETLDAPMLAGRAFTAAEVAGRHPVVVVNESFVRQVLGGHPAVGRRIRHIRLEEWNDAPPQTGEQPWMEIIGVVRDMGMGVPPDPRVAGYYLPASFSHNADLHLALRVAGDPTRLSGAVRAAAAATDRELRVADLQPLSGVADAELRFIEFWFRVTAGVSTIALLVSLAGIYAVMSFTVSRRTREIGIRIALGSSRLPVVLAILRRPLWQVSAGIVCGGLLTAIFVSQVYGGELSPMQVGLLLAYAVVMLAVCLLAVVVPARRALSIDPTEALRAD